MEKLLKRWMRENDYGNWTKQTEVMEMMHLYAKEISREAWYESAAEIEARKKMPEEPFLEFDEWFYQYTN
jgi:hypothetical protein